MRITSMMSLIAWIGLSLGIFIAGGRWYFALSEFDRGPVDVARDLALIVFALFAMLLAPFFLADWIHDRRREAHRRKLADNPFRD